MTIPYTPLAVLFSLLWASAFIAVKFALRSSPPLFLMGFRFLLAGAALLVIAWLRGNTFPNSLRDWRRLAILGLLNNATYLGISAIALRSLSAGMGAVVIPTFGIRSFPVRSHSVTQPCDTRDADHPKPGRQRH